MTLPIHALDRCGEVPRIARSQLKPNPDNPRRISAEKKKRLAASLEENGLIEPLKWNKRSGQVVGGHQRLSILDKSAPAAEWAVPVIILDLDEAQERAANIALNNAEAQGEFDLSGLTKWIRGDDGVKLSLSATGFDPAALASLFPKTVTQSMPDVRAVLQQTSAKWQASKAKQDAAEDAAVQRIASDQLQGDAVEERIMASDDDFYVVVVFRDFAQAMKFKGRLGVDQGERFVDGRVVQACLKDS